MEFNYEIKFPDGKFYNGRAPNPEIDPAGMKSEKFKAFTYTEAGAYKKIENFPVFFAGCEVVNVC